MRPLLRRVDRLQRLAVFEAAARLGSFTAAGSELGMTQPAVTRQIRSLERALGTELFRRTSNRSELTEQGRRLLDTVDVGFSTIEHTLDEISDMSEIFVLATPPGFSEQLVVPHLDSLQEALPDRDLRLWLYDRDGELAGGSFDAAVRVGDGGWPGTEARFLFPERVVPVATPSAAAGWGLTAASSPVDVLDAPLLHMDAADRPWMSWGDWFATFDIDLPPGRGRVVFNNYPTVLQQAVAGRGVALGWYGLVDELLNSGVLTIVGPPAASDSSYWVTWPARRNSASLTALLGWLGERVTAATSSDPDQ